LGLYAQQHFYATNNGKGPARTVKRQVYSVYSNQIQTPHELFNYSSSISKTHNITFFYVQEEQILNYKTKIADQSAMAVAIPGTQGYNCFQPLNSKTITAAVTLCSPFTTHLITQKFEPHSWTYWHFKGL
jgi:hypothetical protein